jgi:hypothetical protein
LKAIRVPAAKVRNEGKLGSRKEAAVTATVKPVRDLLKAGAVTHILTTRYLNSFIEAQKVRNDLFDLIIHEIGIWHALRVIESTMRGRHELCQ